MFLQRLRVAAAGATLIALCAASPALAAGDWLPTEKVTEADRAVPQVGMFGDGETLAVWGTGYSAVGPPEAVTRSPGTPFSPAQQLTSSTESAKSPVLALNEAGAAAAAWVTSADAWIALRAAGGGFGEPRDMTSYDMRASFTGSVAIDRSGNAYALLRRFGDGNTTALDVATVPADGSAITRRTVAQVKEASGPSMTVDPGGTVTVAWKGVRDDEAGVGSRVFVATAAPGADFGEPTVVSSVYRDNNTSQQATRTVTNARGDVLVLWPVLDRPVTSDMAVDQTVRGAFRPAGGSFGPEEQVPMPDERSRGTFSWHAAMGPDGDAVVAWSSLRNVSMTYRPASGPFEPAHIPPPFPICCDQSITAHTDPTVAFDGLGNAAVAYRGSHRVEVVRRPRGSGFLPPQSAGESPFNLDLTLAFDGNGRGIVMWAAQEESGTDDSRTDFGIYAAEYDPTAPPRLTRILVRSKRRLGIESTDQGRARLTIRRKGIRQGKPVLVKQPHVVPGYNPIALTKKQRRALRRKARYVAVATVTDRDGHTSPPTTVRFR